MESVATTIKRITDLERGYVQEVLDAEFRGSKSGRMTRRLEEAFARTFDCQYAISFVNGTATMHAVLAAAGVGAGDEVIVPPLTMASTTMAVLHCGATPVFADIEPDTWTIDPASVRARVTPATKAIIPVALYGLPPDMDPLMAIAGEHNLLVLEDDAQCFLGYYKGRIIGSIGQASSFSFQSSKHMTSGEGGMVTTNDRDLADRIRRFNSLGYAAVKAGQGKITKDVIQDPDYCRHASVGFNYRLPELCAAVALGQLERLTTLVALRRQAAGMFADAVAGCSWIVPQRVPEGSTHAWWTWVMRLADDAPVDWYEFRKRYLAEGGDGVYGAWQLTYLEPAFRHRQAEFGVAAGGPVWDRGLCPVAERVQPRVMQFKTNYFDPDVAAAKADALRRTIAALGS
jgi:perosamine synthetase